MAHTHEQRSRAGAARTDTHESSTRGGREGGDARPLARTRTTHRSRDALPVTRRCCGHTAPRTRTQTHTRGGALHARSRSGDSHTPPHPRVPRSRGSPPLRGGGVPGGARPSAPHGGATAAGLLRGASAPCGPHVRGGGGGGGRRAHVAIAGPVRGLRRRGDRRWGGVCGKAGRRRRRRAGLGVGGGGEGGIKIK